MEKQMTGKILAAAILAISLGTPAFAQNGGGGGNEGNSLNGGSGAAGSSGGSSGTSSMGTGSMRGTGNGWSGNIGSMFYSDANGTTLRSRDEVRQRWGSLSSQEQARVRSDCDEIGRQAASNNGRTPGTEDTSRRQVSGAEATELPQNSGAGSSASGSDTGTTASVNRGSMRDACDMIKGM